MTPEPTLHFLRAPTVLGKKGKKDPLPAVCQSRKPGNTQHNTAQDSVQIPRSQSYMVLFQVVQHAENGVRDNRRLGTVRPSGLRKKFHSHCILGSAQPTASQPPTSSPPMLLHCSENASRDLDYQISRRGAKVHRNKCSSCLSIHLYQGFMASLCHCTQLWLAPAAALGGSWGPSCLLETLHLLEEGEKNTAKIISKTKQTKIKSKKFKTNMQKNQNKYAKMEMHGSIPCFTKIQGILFKNLVFLQRLTDIF